MSWLLLIGNSAGADTIAEARLAADQKFQAELSDLVAWCQGQKLADAAKSVEAWQIASPPPATIYLFDLAEPTPLPMADGKSTAGDEFATRFRQLREEQATRLFALARRAVDERRCSLAWELVYAAARQNPDEPQLRRMLGFVRNGDAWHTPFEVKQLKAGRVWTDEFGWLPQTYLARYQAGSRQFAGRWMSAADEARERSDISKGWKIETEHYLLTTNHSLEEGVKLARRLERFYRAWQQVYIRYLMNEGEFKRWFEGRGAGPRDGGGQHDVVYFRTRDEYNAALRPQQPRIEITQGIYFDREHKAYFFAGSEQSLPTLYHEATHQLFHETRPVAKDVGRRDNFWIIEAVACYWESFEELGGYCRLGGADQGRLPAARQRLLVDQFYVPLARLTAYGMFDLQRDPNIAPLYSQSAGLAAFFMHGAGGRYRDSLVAYLDAVYAGRVDATSLSKLTGASSTELDAQYREFLQQLEAAK